MTSALASVLGADFLAADVTAPSSGIFDALVPLPVLLPLLAASLSVIFARLRNVQRVLSIVALLGVVANNVVLLSRVDDATGDAAGGIVVSQAGG